MLITDFLSESTSRFEEKVAVVCDGRRVTYGELTVLSNRLANALVENGVQPGDRVAILLENSFEAVVSVFGVLKAGAAFVFINHTTKPDKLEFILSDCSPAALIMKADQTQLHRNLIAGVESNRCLVECGESDHGSDAQPGVVRFNRDLSSFSSSCPGARVIDADLAALIYTSGSTGQPKGVAVSHLNVVSAAGSITTYLRNDAADVVLNVLPMSFDYGLYQLLMSVRVGATLVLERSFAYPFSIVERIHQERVTGFPGVPAVFGLLLRMTDLEPDRLDSVRYVTNTAEALPPSHVTGIKRLFRNAEIFSMYGLTECKRVSYLAPDELERRPDSVGKAMPNVEVAVVDENGNPVPPGVVGELTVRGANVMLGYWNRPKETAAVIRSGRYPWERVLLTGDLFKTDEDGFLYFVSRKDNMIKSRGEKVSPTEVEKVIGELTGVEEVLVVGVADPVWGQFVKAFVVRSVDSRITESEITRHCATRLENFMVPKEVEFREALPRTESGKLQRSVTA